MTACAAYDHRSRSFAEKLAFIGMICRALIEGRFALAHTESGARIAPPRIGSDRVHSAPAGCSETQILPPAIGFTEYLDASGASQLRRGPSSFPVLALRPITILGRIQKFLCASASALGTHFDKKADPHWDASHASQVEARSSSCRVLIFDPKKTRDASSASQVHPSPSFPVEKSPGRIAIEARSSDDMDDRQDGGIISNKTMPEKDQKNHTLKAVPKRVAADLDECPKCFGTGMEVVQGKGAKICDCRKLKAKKGQFESVRLPRRYDGFHFSNYKPQTPSQEAAFRFAQSLTHEYPAVERGLLLMGTVGVGKTHLAVSILKGLTERGFNCLFYEFGSLLKEIQDSYNPNTHASELGVLAPVLNAEILVLDELGASKPTDWVRDTMAHIINSRYNDRRLTIFTTNYLDDRRTDREETLEDRIGTRLRSRLFEMCKTVTMDGRDFRRTYDRSPNAPVRA